MSENNQAANNVGEQADKFEAWGLLELFGHQRLAGRMADEKGARMIRFLWAIAYSFGVLYVSGLAFKWIGVAPQPFSESDVYAGIFLGVCCHAILTADDKEQGK